MKELTEYELRQLDFQSLKDLFFNVRSIINIRRKNLEETKNLEIYLCYITKTLEEK